MLIQITNRCHMGCKHCMQDASPKGKHMTDETFDQVMDFCMEARPMVVNVTGGEPTEHPNWVGYVKTLYTLPSVKIVTILTNGAWIDDDKQRLAMAKLIRTGKGNIKVQVYSHPKYYPDHEWTVEHAARFRSIGAIPDFKSPIFMQDLGRARKNCQEEVKASDHVPSCINSHLAAMQTRSFPDFFMACLQAAKFCRPLIDPDGNGYNTSIDEPNPTVTTKERHALVSADGIDIDKPMPDVPLDQVRVMTRRFMANEYSGGGQIGSIETVSPAVLCNPKQKLVTAEQYLMNPQYQSAGGSIDPPCFTLIAHMDKMPPYLVSTEHGDMGIAIYETDSPMTRKVKEFMAMYGIIDVKMRMLNIRELKRIMGFPEDYTLVGTQAEQKKYIGNAVEVNMARVLCEALCDKLNNN